MLVTTIVSNYTFIFLPLESESGQVIICVIITTFFITPSEMSANEEGKIVKSLTCSSVV